MLSCVLKPRGDTLVLNGTILILMKRVFISRFLPLIVAMLLGVVSSWAQVSFTANAPSLVEKSGRPFQVEFTVDAEPDRGSLVAPSFEGFDVLAGPATSVGQSVQFINGKQTSSYTCTYTYTLKAKSSGKYTVGQATIKVDGKQYATNPITIEVIEGRSDDAGSTSNRTKDGVVLRWELSDREIYKGEAVRASLVLYYNVNIQNITNYVMGTFENFWSQELQVPSPDSRAEYNGRVYNTFKIAEYLLIPQSSGNITLPEASLDAIVLVPSEDGYYDMFFGRQWDEEVHTLATKATSIKVKEFPKGAPASFRGAVGNFTWEYTLPQESIDINSSSKVSVTISGEGNLKFITAPEFTLPKSFEVYDTTIEESIQNTNSGVQGHITYSYPFVARAAGDFEISPIEFTYFNPSTERYETLTTGQITLNVVDVYATKAARGGAYNESLAIPVGSPMPARSYSAGGDIRHIRYIKDGALPTSKSDMLLFSNTYWLIILACVVLFVAIFVIMRQRIRANRNVVARRMKRADKVAIQRLRMANKSMKEGDRHAFYEEILRAMWGYISDKFNIPVANLTKETIREVLSHRGVDDADVEQFCQIISRADEAQYAPMVDDDMSGVYMDAVDAISKIESAVKH